MKKILVLTASYILSIALFAQGTASAIPNRAGFSLGPSGAISYPLGSSADYFDLGYSGSLLGELRFPGKAGLGLLFGAGYDYLPLVAGPALNLGRAELGLGIGIPLGRAFELKANALGGGFYGTMTGAGSFATALDTAPRGASVSGGLELGFRGIPSLDIALGARYRNLLGLYGGVEGYLGATIGIKAKKASQNGPRIVPLSASGLAFGNLAMGNVFPVFFKYYNDHPMGSATITNSTKNTLSDISVSFFMKQYMDAPKVLLTLPSLEAGKSLPVPILALFTDKVLEITEGTMVNGEISLSYTEKGQAVSASGNQAIRLLDRNAMSWFDDRGAAAFVTAKDPAVLTFSKNVVSSVKDVVRPSLNKNLQIALAIHDALDLHGLGYVVDPQSAYATNASSKDTVDFLQFPRQTLEYKAGDCDDLSILYSALLESVGIETAFITIPGHIYMAFNTGTAWDEARRLYTRPEDLIQKGGDAWVPVEITDRKGGFLQAWQEGAQEWRDNDAKALAKFYAVHESWSVFEPVGLPGTPAAIPSPAEKAIVAKSNAEIVRFLDRELQPQIAKLQADIKASQGSPKSANSLGVLYAKYGLYDKAESQFQAILSKGDFLPSLVNLGGIKYLEKDLGAARSNFERAYKLEPKSAAVVLGLARVNQDEENYGSVKKLYSELQVLNPALAQQFSYLGTKDDSASRADDVTAQKQTMIWVEQ